MNEIKLESMENEIKRTLYVRFPRIIRNMDEVRDIFPGVVQIKLPRQSARHAVVVFPSIKDAQDNLNACKNKVIDNERITVRLLKSKTEVKPKKLIKEFKPKKKVPQLPEFKPTRSVFVNNIPEKTNIGELKQAFRDCRTATFILTSEASTIKRAIVKFHSSDIADDYLTGRATASVRGNQLKILPDTRMKKKSPQELKVWDGDEDITEKFVCKRETKKSSSNLKLKNENMSDDDVKTEEDSE